MNSIVTSICETAMRGVKYLQSVTSSTTTTDPEKEEEDKLEGLIWNNALFFPDYFPEKEDSTTRILIWYLEQAETTLDLCLYSLQFRMLEETVLNIQKKGVKVRILSNRPVFGNRRFRRAGVETRVKKHYIRNPKAPNMFMDLMHNKFVLIDNYAAMGGSLNWTVSGITENKENVFITNNEAIVKKYRGEFERLWAENAYVFPCPMGPC